MSEPITAERFYKLFTALAVRRDISPAAKIVKAIIADRIGNNGHAWPGIRTLAKDAGLSHEGVIKCLKSLEASGDIQIDRQGNGQVNHYRLMDIKTVQQSGAPNKVHHRRPTKLHRSAQQSCT